MSFGEIRYAVDDGVAMITLDRPDKFNAVTRTNPWWTTPPEP